MILRSRHSKKAPEPWLPAATNLERFALSPDAQKLLEAMGHLFGAPQYRPGGGLLTAKLRGIAPARSSRLDYNTPSALTLNRLCRLRVPMTLETLLTFSAVAGIAIVSPGPATLLAMRNGSAFGIHAAIWSSLGNVSGLFCVSAATLLGLGVLLKSSALLFAVVKTLGALYLFYIGLRQLFARTTATNTGVDAAASAAAPAALRLYREAFLVATTNPKAILFFTALFPQFIDAHAPLLAQFLVLTGVFMALSFSSLVSYALVARRARHLFVQPLFARWGKRLVGAVFIAFGAALLTLRRPLS